MQVSNNMPQFEETALNKMVVKSTDPTVVTLTTICEKYNIQKGKFLLKPINNFNVDITIREEQRTICCQHNV